MTKTDLEKEVKKLEPWFHNLHLPKEVQTAPNHIFGDFPSFKWQEIASHIPADLSGWKVLDIGCNAGFYSFELAKRGAEVLGIDLDAHYLKQAKWAAKIQGLEGRIRFMQMQVYDLADLDEQFDMVWFMGVFYHLRYPTLAMDIVAQKVKKMLVFQTLMTNDRKEIEIKEDYAVDERDVFQEEGFPKMAYVKEKFAGDVTNWWIPNHGAVKGLIESCGLKIEKQPLDETYICIPEKNAHSVVDGWNKSEYLSAIGKEWKEQVEVKIKKEVAD